MFIISSDDAPVVRAAASAPAWRVWLQDALAQRLEPPAAAPAASAFVQGIAVAFRPFVNHFRGRKSVELQVCDWQPAAALAKNELCA